MPTIPLLVSKDDVSTEGLDRSYSRNVATPDNFGGQVGEALQQFGKTGAEAAGNLSKLYEDEQKKKRNEDVANLVAQTNLAQPAMEVQQSAPPDGSGVVEATEQAQRKVIDDKAATIQDMATARAYRTHMYGTLPHYTAQATQFQFAQAEAYSKLQANTSLTSLSNSLRMDPSEGNYALSVQKGNAVIDESPSIGTGDKAKYKTLWSQQAANTRFEGMLATAKTTEDVENIQKELGRSGVTTLNEKDFETVGKTIRTDIEKRMPAIKSVDFAALEPLAISTRLNPDQYDKSLADGYSVIDKSKGIQDYERDAYRKQWEQTLSNARNEGVVGRVNTSDQATAAESEIQNDTWRKRMSDKDFEALQRHLASAKVSIQTKADTDARTAVELLEARSKDGEVIPSGELTAANALVQQSKNTMTAVRMGRIARDQDLIVQGKGLPPSQMQLRSDAARGGAGASYPGLPAEVSGYISDATRVFPGISASYLGATATREYGQNFKPNGQTDYTKGTSIKAVNGDPTSSATGLYQFTWETWRNNTDPAKNPEGVAAVKLVTGVDLAAMSPGERMAYRGNPHVSTVMAASLAQQNKNDMENSLGRQVSDAELYMAHLLGANGAKALIRTYQTSPDTSAAAILPAAASSNRPVFFDKNGDARSVRQIYDTVNAQFSASPSYVAHGDAEFWKARKDAAVAELKRNTVGYAQKDGGQTIVPLDGQGGWQARGAAYRNIGLQYEVPKEDNKPFNTDTEVPQLQQTIKDGSAEQVVQLLNNMASMEQAGPGSLDAGMKQLGIKDTSYEVAAQLSQTDPTAAAQVIRGQKRLDQDKGEKVLLGDEHEARDTFNKTVGNALAGLDPKTADGIRQAATAHYIEGASIAGNTKFDDGLFKKSVDSVLGGQGNARLGVVNSATTILPKGVDAATMERAVDNLQGDDLVRLSVDRNGKPTGSPPMYTSGKPVPPSDISTQGRFKYIGGDTYQIQMGDGRYLATAQVERGGFTPYLMKIPQTEVQRLAVRPATRSVPTPENAMSVGAP